jgi:hypothetical protein
MKSDMMATEDGLTEIFAEGLNLNSIAVPTTKSGQKMRPVAEEVFVQGYMDQVPSGSESLAFKAFQETFVDLYFDSDRTGASETLCPLIFRLVNRSLSGQRNCFLGLGVRGIGKSQYFIALGDWACKSSTKNFAFLYKEMGSVETASIFDLRTTNIRKMVHYLATLAGWEGLVKDPWNTIGNCWEWLVNNNKQVLLVLDEFEKTYRVENTGGLIADLSAIGGRSGPRPIVIILLGSSSVLRSLCFCTGNRTELADKGFLGYSAASMNLNSTKYIPLLFGPITSIAVTDEKSGMCKS